MWSLEKQRRSRVDWPDAIAVNQVAWERRQTALAMHNAGMKQREIAELFGVTGSRISQFIIKARKETTSPVEAVFNPKPRREALRLAAGIRRYVMRLPSQ